MKSLSAGTIIIIGIIGIVAISAALYLLPGLISPKTVSAIAFVFILVMMGIIGRYMISFLRGK